MILFYNIGIRLYAFALTFFATFHPKAKLLVNGRKNSKKLLESIHWENQKVAWFHAASLGEFEQGRPVLERFRLNYPNYKIVLSFYSPSGYEVRKNYEIPDLILYLPADLPHEMTYYVQKLNPEILFLIKYEFWYHLIDQAIKHKTKIYSISSIFRTNQYFFKSFGTAFLTQLKNVHHFFVQDEKSKQILENHNITSITIVGDTRFDRVYQLSQQTKEIAFMKSLNSSFTLVAGSTWPICEDYFIKYINTHPALAICYILVPHDIHKNQIQALQSKLKVKSITYSALKNEPSKVVNYTVIIIDTIGLLTSLYQYADLAYVGGGFGQKGIHNVLEPACYGTPVFYGPHFEKFREAKELVFEKGAIAATNYTDFESIITDFYQDVNKRTRYGENAKSYVQKNIGATTLIFDYLAQTI